MTDTATPAPAAAPAPTATPATGGSPTHVTQTAPIGYQPTTPAPETAVTATPAPAATSPAPAPSPAPDASAMKAYLADKAKDVSLEGKSDADIQQLYADAKAKEATAQAEFKLPDEYKDKPWAAKIKSQDDLYKQIDNLQSLVGKKAVVPNLKESTPEEREAFYAQLRGKDASEYPMPESKVVPIPPETQGVVAKLFMENGISPVQAEPILKGYLALREQQVAAYYKPEDFTKSMQEAFGPDHAKVTGEVRNSIKGMMSAEDFKALDALPNHLLGLVYRTLGNTVKAVDQTLKKYGASETFAHLQAPNGKLAPTDLSSVRQGIRDQMSALSMRPHTAAEQQALSDALAKTYENDPRLTQQA